MSFDLTQNLALCSNRSKLLEEEGSEQAARPETAGTYKTARSELTNVEQKQASEYPAYLPFTVRKLRRVVVEGKGDLSYKTLADLQQMIRQHYIDRAAMKSETDQLNAKRNEVNVRTDAILAPLEEAHITNLAALKQDRADFESECDQKVGVQQEAVNAKMREQQKEQSLLVDVQKEFEFAVKEKDDVVARVSIHRVCLFAESIEDE